MTRAHRILAVVIGLVVPLASWGLGSGQLSYRMYAHAPEYRLDVFAVSVAGARHRVAPSALAQGVKGSVVPLVAGADHWRTQPRIEDLRGTLSELARHGCAIERVSSSVEIVLEERAREGDAVRTTRAVARCDW